MIAKTATKIEIYDTDGLNETRHTLHVPFEGFDPQAEPTSEEDIQTACRKLAQLVADGWPTMQSITPTFHVAV